MTSHAGVAEGGRVPDSQEERNTTMSTNPTPAPASRVPAAVAGPAQTARFSRGRVLRLVFGGLGLLAALALIGSGAASTWALEQRDGSGYFTTATHRFHTSSYA